jgi:hypothetical protein
MRTSCYPEQNVLSPMLVSWELSFSPTPLSVEVERSG